MIFAIVYLIIAVVLYYCACAGGAVNDVEINPMHFMIIALLWPLLFIKVIITLIRKR